MNIPENLLREAVRVSQAPTQTMAVVMGLQELIRRRKVAELLQLKGSGVLNLSRRGLKQMRRR